MYTKDIWEIFIKFKYLGFIYINGLPCKQPNIPIYVSTWCTYSYYSSPIRKVISFVLCNKSKGEEYRIGNVGDLYFFTFWWIQWFAKLGNFWFSYRGLNLESWVDIWSHKDWSSEIGIGQGNNAEKETTESFLELLCNFKLKHLTK